MDATIKVAAKYPNVFFEHCTGFKRAANVSTYAARFYEGRYIQGQIAAKMSCSRREPDQTMHIRTILRRGRSASRREIDKEPITLRSHGRRVDVSSTHGLKKTTAMCAEIRQSLMIKDGCERT